MNFTVQLSLPTVNRVLTAVHKLCSQAHFYYTLHQGSVSVTLGSRWYSTFCWQFILLQYVLPLGSTSTSLAIYSNPTPNIQCIAGHAQSAHSWALCRNETRKHRSESVIQMVNVLFYILNTMWIPMVTHIIHGVQCWLQHTVQLLIISSEFNIRVLIKPWR